MVEVGEYALGKLKPRVASFEESDAMMREHLSRLYIEREEYVGAASMLAGINLESESRKYEEAEKAEKYITIAELYLQEDLTVEAEGFLNRASQVVDKVESWTLVLRYKVSYARVLDAKRKFLEAAVRYYELSQTQTQDVVQDDLLQLLGKSVTCAILAPAGPQRTRLLGTLSKDERLQMIEFYGILEKMYMEQLLSSQEVKQFDNSLMPHQKAILANGSTVLEHAVTEHNMLAISKIYHNIRFSELGTLLEVEPAKVRQLF
jgi:COP9 signalosome complex subunit 4